MKEHTSFLKTRTAFVLYNILAAVIIGLLIMAGVFFWLNRYTEHGKQTSVPSVCGMYLEEAQITLAAQGLKLEVIDSTYSKKVPLGTIVEQNPPANVNVKHGRSIYVIMNARIQRQVPLPELHDVSFRQAQATLNALGLQVDSIRYEPSEYRNLVLDVRYREKAIEAGTRLPEGAGVMLIVGKGNGTEEVVIPDLTGQTLLGARMTLLASKLIVGAVHYDNKETLANSDELETSETYYVYYQKPQGGQWVREGSHVDIYLSDNPDKKPDIVSEDDEDFF